MDEEATQRIHEGPDPRRTGDEASLLGLIDPADVICILHPCSLAALETATRTAERKPQHVLQLDSLSESHQLGGEDTFILPENRPHRTPDLALRFSSPTVNPASGFVFGRNPVTCDFVMVSDKMSRVSNNHFRIFFNDQGVLMLHDISTNGTVVDEVHLVGKSSKVMQTRMLNSGSIIQLLSQNPEEIIKFIVRIPSRVGYEESYQANFRFYMETVASANAMAARTGAAQSSRPFPVVKNDWGMHWNGGQKYNVIGHLGKGAFATVFQLATKAEGFLYAAKELEKRKFMKHGILDRKLDNEMQIMKDLMHDNIVQYIEYYDHDKYLYIIMEYIPYGDLQQYISTRGPLPESLSKTMANQVLSALSYLHTKRITHRDIKPDNILIANNDPDNFWVKLSDFGLSKVVKDNDTFLKTFCGTLLYCAPEVFPHYEGHTGRKRPRKTGTSESRKYHCYSQTVDVWSFGAVLWFALCGKTPFEGVMDATGRLMFEKIMQTPLDPRPLLKGGVSTEAIDLLFSMLNTDPSERPTPAQCRHAAWFAPDGFVGTDSDQQPDDGLNAIVEADEEPEEDEEEYEEEEPDLSQLNIHDDGSLNKREVSLNSSDLDFLDPRESKRFKHYSSQEKRDSSDSSQTNGRYHGISQGNPQKSRLFGEVTPSMLKQTKSDHVNDKDGCDDSVFDDQDGNTNRFRADSKTSGPQASYEVDQPRPDSFTTGSQYPSTSLSGAATMVRDFNMESPESSNSFLATNNPTTPQTPENNPGSVSQNDGAEETPTKGLDTTPRPAVFSRQIDVNISASFFFDPNDPTTHTAEYASLRSGHDFVSNPTVSASSFHAQSRISTDQAPAKLEPAPTLPDSNSKADADFTRPPPRLGRLVSTPSSFADITIPLTRRKTSWGRDSNCDIRWPNGNDIRVPKQGLMIQFAASGTNLDSLAKTGKDWTKTPGLFCGIATRARAGIWINGIQLKEKDERGTLYGELCHGDVVRVRPRGRKGMGRGDGLEFVVELWKSRGKEGRTEEFEVLVEEVKGKSA